MVPKEMLALKWNNHSSIFLGILSELLDKASYCDATVACQGRLYSVHRFVLAACSEYFKDIFAGLGDRHAVIVLKDVTVEVFTDLLKYMYQGEIKIEQDKLARLISAAEYLKIKGLAEPKDEVHGEGNDDISDIDVVSSSSTGGRRIYSERRGGGGVRASGNRDQEFQGDKRKFVKSHETRDSGPNKRKRKNSPPVSLINKNYMSDSSETQEILNDSVKRPVKEMFVRGGPSSYAKENNNTDDPGVVKKEPEEVFVLEDTSSSGECDDATTFPSSAAEGGDGNGSVAPQGFLKTPSATRDDHLQPNGNQVPFGTADVKMLDDFRDSAPDGDEDVNRVDEDQVTDLELSPKLAETLKNARLLSATTSAFIDIKTAALDEKRRVSCSSSSAKPALPSVSSFKFDSAGERKPKTKDCQACETKTTSKHRIIHSCYSSRGEIRKFWSPPKKELRSKDGGSSSGCVGEGERRLKSSELDESESPPRSVLDSPDGKLPGVGPLPSVGETPNKECYPLGSDPEAETNYLEGGNNRDCKDKNDQKMSSSNGGKEKPGCIVLKRDNFEIGKTIKRECSEVKPSMGSTGTLTEGDETTVKRGNDQLEIDEPKAARPSTSGKGKPMNDGGNQTLNDDKPSGSERKCHHSGYAGNPSGADDNFSGADGTSYGDGGNQFCDEGDPSGDEGNPFSYEEIPSGDEGHVSGEDGKPSSGEYKFSCVEGKSSTVEDVPFTGEGKPYTSEGKPYAGEDNPSTGESKTTTGEGKISTGQDKISSSEGKVFTSEGKTSTGGAKTSTAEDKPSSKERKLSSGEAKLTSRDCKPYDKEDKLFRGEGSKLSKGHVKSYSSGCKAPSKKSSGSSLDPRTLPDVDLDCDFINPTTERHLEKYTHGSLQSKLDNYGNWKCPICYYKTQDKTKYERHLREHLRRKTYCCRHCSYRTVIHQSFVVHLRKHSGVRPYKCLFCDFAATQKGNLDAHVRKHYNS